MASHSGYPHVLLNQHSQPAVHLSPPPLSTTGQVPNQRLPSLRSLNFAYHPVGEPGSTPMESTAQSQPRSDQASRTQYGQQEDYYHQRDMSFFQDATSSDNSGPSQNASKRPRSTSNPGQRSPYNVQPHLHSHSSSTTYQSQTLEEHGRASTAAGTYPQGHPPTSHTQYSPANSQPSETGHPSYYPRLPQSSQAWYYSAAQQTSPQQHSSHDHTSSHQPPVHNPNQHTVHPTSQKTLHFQQYSAPSVISGAHSPRQTSSQAPPPPQRAAYQSTPVNTQSQSTTQVHSVSESTATASGLQGSGSATAATGANFGSSPTPAFTSSSPSLTTASAGARVADSKALGEDAERAAASGLHLSKITEHSSVLCEFANRYGQLPHLRPSQSEVAEMAQRATLVLHLVEHLRRMASVLHPSPTAGLVPSEREREREREKESGDEKKTGSKKRPWEDATGDTSASAGAGSERSPEENTISSSSFELKDLSTMRSVADQDMAIIRSKRGQGTGGPGTVPGQAKAKYRKRSRATPPGKCHSCNIRETPEWRRGPDGARTLCNACGLHYAKLIRKRDKTLGSGADAIGPPIDLEMLRQSTRAGEQSSQTGPGHHKPEHAGFRDDMTEIQLQPVGMTMQVHQWTPPGLPHRDEDGGYGLGAYSTSLMRSSNARGSPA